MNPSPFGRLVWKEARVQIGLWCALVCGAVLLQALAMVTSGGFRPGSSVLSVVVAIAFVLTACFAVASLGLLFAGEAEEGTRAWLQQLPIRPATLIGAKLSFAVCAIVFFFAASSGTGAVVAVLFGGSVNDFLQADVSDYQKSIAGAFAWGLLFSLLFRRVMQVLLAAVVAEIVTVGFADNVISPAMSSWFGRPVAIDGYRQHTYFVLVGLVLLLDLVLVVRWAHSGSGAVIPAPRRMKSLELPGHGRRARTWLRLVSWAARRGSPDTRETAVLAWREARSAVPFASGWLLLGFIATDFGWLFGVPGQVWYRSPLQTLYLIATPAVCGLMTCLGDHRQQVYRFLGERGVAPSRVWWVKQAIWFGLAVVLCCLFLRWDSTAAERLRRNDHSGVSAFMELILSLHAPTDVPARAYDRPEDTALQLRCLWALGLALYAAGQCASFWVRRPILAFGGMLIAAPILVSWHSLLALGDVPFWLGSWPLTFALLAATLSSASAWLRGRDSWKLRLTRLAAILLPVGAVAMAAAAHRANSMTYAVFPPDVLSAIAARDLRTEQPDPSWSLPWKVVLQNFPGLPQSGSVPIQYQGIAAKTRDDLLALSEALASGAHGTLDPLVLSPDRPVSVQTIASFLSQPSFLDIEGRRAVVAAGTIEEQWTGYEAGLRITRYFAEESQSAEQWTDCVQARGVLFARIRQWSHGPDQTPESLQRALTFLVEDLGKPLEARQMIINRQVFYDQLLNHRGRRWAELSKQLEQHAGVDATMIAAVMPGFERERALRVLSRITETTLAGRNTLRDAYSIEGEQLRRWAASTSALPMTITGNLYSRDDSGQPVPGSVEGVLQQAVIQELGTASIVALQLFHSRHGEFPQLLSDALPEPLQGRLYVMDRRLSFTYERQGLSDDLYLPYGLVIPAGQPLLWTPGAASGRIIRADQDIHNGEATIPRGAYHLVGQTFAPKQGVLGRQILKPDQVLYLDLTRLEADVLDLSVAPVAPGNVRVEPLGASGALTTASPGPSAPQPAGN